MSSDYQDIAVSMLRLSAEMASEAARAQGLAKVLIAMPSPVGVYVEAITGELLKHGLTIISTTALRQARLLVDTSEAAELDDYPQEAYRLQCELLAIIDKSLSPSFSPKETATESHPAPHGWTCFHCKDHFPPTADGEAAAREHFGRTEEAKPLCSDRRTATFETLLARARKAEADSADAWERAWRAQEAQEAAEYVAVGAQQDLAYATRTDIRNQLDSLRGIELSNRLVMAELHKRDPALFQSVHVAAIGPGEYFPPAPTV